MMQQVDLPPPRPIYAGIEFECLLHARWAVYYDLVAVPWQYRRTLPVGCGWQVPAFCLLHAATCRPAVLHAAVDVNDDRHLIEDSLHRWSLQSAADVYGVATITLGPPGDLRATTRGEPLDEHIEVMPWLGLNDGVWIEVGGAGAGPAGAGACPRIGRVAGAASAHWPPGTIEAEFGEEDACRPLRRNEVLSASSKVRFLRYAVILGPSAPDEWIYGDCELWCDEISREAWCTLSAETYAFQSYADALQFALRFDATPSRFGG